MTTTTEIREHQKYQRTLMASGIVRTKKVRPEIPPHIKKALDNYAEHHQPTGGFVRAVLENSLLAVNLADDDSLKAIREIIRYVYNELPGDCWGSKAKVTAWLA